MAFIVCSQRPRGEVGGWVDGREEAKERDLHVQLEKKGRKNK